MSTVDGVERMHCSTSDDDMSLKRRCRMKKEQGT